MIEKDIGKPRIHRLRIIHLFEADFNFYMKLQWGRRLVRRACEYNLLNDGQHGSIPNRSAIDPLMLTQLTTDLCRILKHDLARFDNDASSCYDRIIVALGMLAARRCGMPTNAIRLHSEALQFMKYTVKTMHGISEDNYQGTMFEPLFGTGQGSGASPSVWLSLVVILLNTLDRIIPDRIHFKPITGARAHSRLVDAFVDDTSLGFTSSDDTTISELILRLEKIAQTWEHLLHLSGGKLNLSKCSWYVLRWEWEKGRPHLRRVEPQDPTISLQCGTETSKIPVRRTSLEESTRMLGVLLNPLGDFTDHLKHLKRKADDYASRLLSPRLTTKDIRIFHRSIYIPSMRYSLATIAADEESLAPIQSKILKVMLQKLNVSSTIPAAIRHGPVELGGLALYDLRTEAGLEAVKFFRNAIYSDSETGNLLRINLQYSQWESGIEQPLLEFPSIHVSYLTPSWILSLRQFISCHNITISLTDTYKIMRKSETDQFIMQPCHLQRYSPTQQRDINLVRIYLQVSTLAEMSDQERSTGINLDYLDGKRPAHFSNKHTWPRQQSPSAQQRRLWKRYIRSSFLRYVPYWKAPPLPSALTAEAVVPLPVPTTFPSIKEYLNTFTGTKYRLLLDLEQEASDIEVWRAFRSRKQMFLASDGGLHDQTGTFGWVLSTGKKVLFRCAGPVDGPYDTVSSTRSEICGCASALLLLVAVSRNWGIRHRCSFRWYTDSRSAISRIERYARKGKQVTRMPPDADLLSLISALLVELRRPFKSVWVKGHQDSLKSYAELPLAARLNIDADFLATRYRLRGRLRPSRQVDHVPEQQCSILINGTRITSQYDECVRYHINSYHMRQFMQAKHSWSDAVWEEVDFHTFSSHFRSLDPNKQARHMKIVHNQLPVGSRRYRQASVQSEELKLCPCCRQEEETHRHLLRCLSNMAYDSSIQQLRSDTITADIHPVRYLITEGIQHWSTETTTYSPLLHQYPSHMQAFIEEALQSQDRIGWGGAIKGFLSKSWTSLANLDMTDTNKVDATQGKKRIRQCVKAIGEHTHRIWLARNQMLHAKEDEGLTSIRSTEAAEIRHYHSQPHLLKPGDQHYCTRSLEKLLNGSASTRRRWLRRVKQSSAELTKDGTRQALITTYFPSMQS